MPLGGMVPLILNLHETLRFFKLLKLNDLLWICMTVGDRALCGFCGLSLRQLKNVCKPRVCGRFSFQDACSYRGPGLDGHGA